MPGKNDILPRFCCGYRDIFPAARVDSVPMYLPDYHGVTASYRLHFVRKRHFGNMEQFKLW